MEEKIRGGFKQEWIITRFLDRSVAEIARELIWDSNLHPKDSAQVATALKSKVELLDTFDNELIKLSGQIGDPPLIIQRPHIPNQQLSLPV